MKAFALFQLKVGLSALLVFGLLLLVGVSPLWAWLLAFAFYDLQTILTLGKTPSPSRRQRSKLRAAKLRPVRVYLN